ncbi:MAG: DUF72 domain-containing protein [Candidatus Bathyarchaeota archaeon]|nr:DUF72 domain-containing protein [Candidatus Bathyarchaeota archaeon]
MDVFVGTSGWSYSWNETRRLDWYVSSSGLNAVELNASFYRYPSSNTVEKWAEKGKKLRWAIKVNRLFTHTYKFNEAAVNRWERFQQLFAPLEENVDFYLFQLPPNTTPHTAPLIEKLIRKSNLQAKFALEVRNQQWFAQEWFDWAKDLGITWVSVDAPDLPRKVFDVNGTVYMRMHGRTSWYVHRYTDKELAEVAAKILQANPPKAYVFFNNDTAMLMNARVMIKTLKEEENFASAV